jgi:hypothetical protein
MSDLGLTLLDVTALDEDATRRPCARVELR